MNKLKHLQILIIGMLISISCYSDSQVILGNHAKPPKIHLDNGEPSGVLIGILKYASKKMNQDFSYQLYPWARAYHMAQTAQGGIIGLSMTKERLEIFDYSDVVYYDEVIMVVRKDSDLVYNQLKDLNGKTVGIGIGGSYGNDFEEAKKNGLFEVKEDVSPNKRLRNLHSGTIDVALMGPGKIAFDKIIERDQFLTKNKNDFVILDKLYKKDPNYLGFHKSLGKGSFLEKFNAIIKKGYKNGDIQKIIKQHSN